jgi:ABC-2 type transport system ATP-binding protein
MDGVIEVVGITKSFGKKTVVDNMDLSIKKGEIFGFLGPNGSGKTTMMRMLCGLMKPDSGHGTCLGYNLIDEFKEIKHLVGYMPQHFSYYRELTVYDNLKFIATLYGYSDAEAVVNRLVDRFGLGPWREELSGNLSGGWKQRLSLAAAVMNEPKLLILDEPTAGVDPDARRYFWSEIHQIAKTGVTVFVSTHFMDEAVRCDRLVYMLYGKKVAEGSQDELIQQSSIQVYELQNDVQRVLSVLLKFFPNLSSSIINKKLRIVVGKEQVKLLLWIEESEFIFEPVKPNIEEVFIYYSRGQYV